MNEQTQAVMFSSESEEHATPRALLELVRQEYPIELDVCATPENTACAAYYTKADNGLAQPWTGVCWLNPPYGRKIARWLAKAVQSAAEGATVVTLLPARTDTKWWHTYCQPVLEKYGTERVIFLEGRLHFNEAAAGAPFPSVIVVFAPPPDPRSCELCRKFKTCGCGPCTGHVPA